MENFDETSRRIKWSEKYSHNLSLEPTRLALSVFRERLLHIPSSVQGGSAFLR
jgi:hypothetical protein